MSTTSGDSWQVRRVSVDEWQAVLGWARQEGWDLGEEDQVSFFNADPEGFFVGYLNGHPTASVSVVNHSDRYAHIGHYLVDPQRRGEGWGLRTWNTALEHAGDRVMGGDGMLAQEANYRKSGLITYYRTIRFSGLVPRSFQPAETAITVQSKHLDEILDYDETCLGVRRTAFLKDWFTGPGRYGFLTRRDNRITGLIGIRPSTDGYRLGPWYAGDSATARDVLETALAQVPVGARVTFDAPETSRDSLQLAEELGFTELFPTVRMYRGPVPDGDQNQVKAIATLELG